MELLRAVKHMRVVLDEHQQELLSNSPPSNYPNEADPGLHAVMLKCVSIIETRLDKLPFPEVGSLLDEALKRGVRVYVQR